MEDIEMGEDSDANEIATLLEKIADNPYEYDAHVAYIALLRTLEDREEVRSARETFHSVFPFSEDLWIQWLDDEESAAREDLEVLAVYELYDRAVADYLSIRIWSRYLDFSERHADVIAKSLAVKPQQLLDLGFKKAIAATQYHISESQSIWSREKDRRLQLLQQSRDQFASTKRLFLDRLKVPHAELEGTYAEYSSLIGKYSNDNYEETMSSSSKDYGKSLRGLREREDFELHIRQSGGSFEAFSSYLDWELSSAPKFHNSRLVQTLFERTLVIHWQQPAVWEDYVYYAMQKQFDPEEVVSILERAVRNCPWSGDLWGFYIRYLAEKDISIEDLAAFKNRAIAVPWLSTQKTELVKLYFSWISVCRVAVIDWGEGIKEGELFLRDQLAECLEKVDGSFDSHHGYLLGKLAAGIKQQLEEADEGRRIWDAMAKGNATKCDYLLDRINWERNGKHIGVCKDIFIKNLFKVKDDPVRFHSAYQSFLSEEGSIADLNSGFARVRKIVVTQEKAQTVEPVQVSAVVEPDSVAKVAAPGSEHKRKLSVDQDAAASKKPRGEDNPPTEPKRNREHATILASNFPHGISNDQVRHFFKECGTIKQLERTGDEGDEGESFVIEFENEDEAASAMTKHSKKFQDHEISVNKFDQATLFITNYPPEYDEAKLRELFEKFGEIMSVRLPSLAYNTKRRFAYIQFSNPDVAKAALAMDGIRLNESTTLIVSISDPRKRKARDSPAAEGRELYIVNIPFEAKEEDIRTLLSHYGEIVGLTLLSKKDGGHSGRAFVIFRTKAEADSALAALDGFSFMSRKLKVQRSDPDRSKSTARKPDGAQRSQGRQQQPSSYTRTIAVVGLPDTVNETRLRELVPHHLSLEKIEMKPQNEGAILIFEKEGDAGQASMALEGKEISGGVLRVVSVRDLKQHYPKTGDANPPTAMVPSSVRFGAKKRMVPRS